MTEGSPKDDATDTATDEFDAATVEFGAATDDLRVAAVAAACTITLTLGLRYGLGRDVAFVWRLLPLGPYFLSLFVGRADLGGLDTPRNWSLLTVAVTAVAFVYVGFLA